MIAAVEPQTPSARCEALSVESVSFRYAGAVILENVNLTADEGEFVTMLGASGCGKTTLLRLLAGLEPPATGCIRWNGNPVTGPSLERGIVFQEYSLFPWLRLLDNVALAMRKANPSLKKPAARQAAEAYLEKVGLSGASRKYPHELSGGMRQRGAIASTLALGSPLLLLDEPFGALDPLNRIRLQDLLLEIWAQSRPKRTVIFVTHDVEEALYLGDRVVLLGSNPGRVLGEIPVPFLRPRFREALYESAEFRDLRETVYEYYHRDERRRFEDEATPLSAYGGGI